MVYLVPKGSKKYDDAGNEGKGQYRKFVVKFVPSEPDCMYPCYILHSETFYNFCDFNGWESDSDITLNASEFDEKYYEEVDPNECDNYEPPYNLLFFEWKIKYVKDFSEAEEIYKKETSLEEKWGWLLDSADAKQVIEDAFNEMFSRGLVSKIEEAIG